MKKSSFKSWDLDLYSHTLENGLRIFIVPFPKINNKYVTFSTKYGSQEQEFIPLGEDDMKEVPLGVAHFLEHKLFEQKEGVDPFTFYSSNGCDANANTSTNKTTYLFSGTDFFEEGLEYLIKYVQDPYFTDSNVEKEKGIIEQEMKMYNDNPYSVIFEKLVYNTFVKNPIKYPVIGTKESIYKITKEDLNTCYKTFYNPSNMFIVITGNVDVAKTIELIKDIEEKSKLENQNQIKLKEYDEPDKVAKKYEEKVMNVNLPKVGLGFKINTSKFDMDLKRLKMYISIIFDLLFDSTSIIDEKLKEEGVINDSFALTSIGTDKHLVIYILNESNQYKLLIDRIKNNVKKINISASDLERKKKVYISDMIYGTDNIYTVNHIIMNDIILYNKVYLDSFDMVNSLNIEELNKVIKKLDFNNTTSFVIKNK